MATSLERTRLTPDRATTAALAALGIALDAETTLAGLLRRPEVSAVSLRDWLAGVVSAGEEQLDVADLTGEELEPIASRLRYDGFLKREEEAIRRMSRSAYRPIPSDFVYRGPPGLSLEAAEKLERRRPRTLGQASRIPGVSPAAVTLLLARLALVDRGHKRSAGTKASQA